VTSLNKEDAGIRRKPAFIALTYWPVTTTEFKYSPYGVLGALATCQLQQCIMYLGTVVLHSNINDEITLLMPTSRWRVFIELRSQVDISLHLNFIEHVFTNQHLSAK